MAPKGHLTRPTADRIRQALFNVLEHAAWSPGVGGARVIDLFAGSGALGLEALSRGAESCLFTDQDAAAIAATHANIAALGLAGRAIARQRDATRLPPLASFPGDGDDARPFDLAFLDPPYARGLVEPALAALLGGGWLAEGALVVVERGVGEGAPETPGYELLDTRAWGAARVWFLRPVMTALTP